MILRTAAELSRLAVVLTAAIAAGPIEVEWKRWRKSRSNQQNRYLFGICYPLIAKAKGYTVDDIHEWMCGAHFGWVDKLVPKTPRNPSGVESVPYRTTTTGPDGERDVLKVMEFSEFVDTVHRLAAKAGVVCPDPDPMLVKLAA